MRLILTVLILLLSPAAIAAPIAYSVETESTDIGFFYTFGDKKIRGKFPSFKIDVAIDFEDHKNTKLTAVIDTTKAKGGFAFGTQAMRSAKILSVKKFPKLTFKTTAVAGKGADAEISGILTVRGVSKPITLAAKLFRERGSDPKDLSKLYLKVSGDVNRFDFGAAGYKKEVSETLELDFTVVLDRK